jgi:AcrR family transcriptional regulator
VLTRQRILAAALKLIDSFGLDALSMRRLGSELGVDPMSIYHHIPNKDALLHAVVEDVFARMPAPSGKGAWKRRVREWAHNYRAVALAHPNLVLQIVSDPAAVAVAAVHANESLYAALEASGLPARSVVRAADLVVDYVNGSVLPSAGSFGDDAATALAFEAALMGRLGDQTPVQRRLLADPKVREGRDGFDFGLDVILAGVETLSRG